jgi:hypothetical protein
VPNDRAALARRLGNDWSDGERRVPRLLAQ